MSLNNTLSADGYYALAQNKPSLIPIVFDRPIGPDKVTFQQEGFLYEGIPILDLYPGEQHRLQNPHGNPEISDFLTRGRLQSIKLVIWGPQTPRAIWKHHIRELPTRCTSLVLKDKLSLGNLVAVEYQEFYNVRPLGARMDLSQVRLIALHRVVGDVYQAELDAFDN